MIRSLLLLMFYVLSSSAYAAIETYRWPILKDGNEVFIAGEISKDSQFSGQELDLNISSNRGELTTLGYYYKSAIQQNRSALERLHYLNDGSRSRFAREMQKTPDRYAGFVNLDKVMVGDLYYWGDYVLADVEWFGGGKRLARWREGIACDEYCFITDRFLNTTPEVDAYSAGLYSYGKELGNLAVINIVKRNRLKNSFYITPSVGSDNNPFVLWFKINDYRKKVILTKSEVLTMAEKNSKRSNADYQVVFDFVTSVWKSSDSVATLLQEQGAETAQEEVTSIYAEYWRDFNPKLLMPMFDFSYDSNIPRASVALFSNYALFQRITNWKSIEPVGYMKSDNSTYLVVKGTNELDVEELQIFYVQKDSRGNKQLAADLKEVAVQNIVKTPQFGTELASLYLEQTKPR